MTYRVHEKKFNGYTVYEDNGQWFVEASCGCFACDHGVQEGHFMCSTPSDVMLEAEKRGEVYRVYEDRWVWVMTDKGAEVLYPSVFVKKVRKAGMVEYRILKGEMGFGKVLFSVNGWDNPTAESQMKDAIAKEIGEKGYYIAGDNYTEKE